MSESNAQASEAVRKLLSGLCKTDEDEQILEKLCAAAVSVDDTTMCFKDAEDEEWEAQYTPGGTVVQADGYPQSFCEISRHFQQLYWDGGGPDVGYVIDDDGNVASDPWLFHELRHDSPQECARIEAAGKVRAAFEGGQNGLFFDPTRRLANGEPALAFVSHEGGGWTPVSSTDHLDYGQILLRLLADCMTGTNYIPEVNF